MGEMVGEGDEMVVGRRLWEQGGDAKRTVFRIRSGDGESLSTTEETLSLF
jgi:hypothetical protein